MDKEKNVMENEELKLLNEKLEMKTKHNGYHNRLFSLYELRTSANNYSSKDDLKYRKLLKKKYAKIYNCPFEKIPTKYLKEVFGVDDNVIEIWKEVPGYKKGKNGESYYKVSSFGRIKHFGYLMFQDDTNYNGYLLLKGYITKPIENFDYDKTTPVYQFVAKAFFDDYKKSLHVHHINNNGYDCRPENVILLEPREHSKVHGFFVIGDKRL